MWWVVSTLPLPGLLMRDTVRMDDLYVVAGTDLEQFVTDWLALIDQEVANYTGVLPGALPGLLEHAEDENERGDRYFYGSSYVFSQVAPSVMGDEGTREQLLLYGVLASYKLADFPNAPRNGWDGIRQHVERAFAYVREVGEATAAQALRADVARHAQPLDADHPGKQFEDEYWNKRTPGQRAAHEQLMAQGSMRDLRAASALDPHGEFTL